MSLVPSTSKAMASPPSPLPLAGPDSSELSMTGLLSPEIDLTKDMSEELNSFFKDLEEEYTRTVENKQQQVRAMDTPTPTPICQAVSVPNSHRQL